MRLGLTGDVIDHHSNSGVSDVAGNKAAEALLPCSVPQLEPNLRDQQNRGVQRKKTQGKEKGRTEKRYKERIGQGSRVRRKRTTSKKPNMTEMEKCTRIDQFFAY